MRFDVIDHSTHMIEQWRISPTPVPVVVGQRARVSFPFHKFREVSHYWREYHRASTPSANPMVAPEDLHLDRLWSVAH